MAGKDHYIGRSTARANTSLNKKMSPFGRIASGTYLKVHVKNVADSEARELRVLTPYGFVSGPMPELFAQIIFNDFINNCMAGIWNDKAPEAKAGETILYNKGKCRVKLDENDSITLTNGAATIEMKADGTINITGSTINMKAGTINLNS